ncbi:MAG: hypothetical protein F4X11_08770 [Acidobacteria bacterium]|nr:hypothetical protein [Acidobacteriota bacterium]
MIRFAVVVAVSVLLVAPSVAGAQSLGQLFIEVVDGAGQFVPGMTPADFVVREDGREAGIVSAEPVGPMKIAFMVDNGDRMVEMNALNALRNGMQGFLEAVPPPHEISLFTIGRNIQRRVDFTTDRGELQRSAGEIFLDRGASAVVLDGIRETWERRFEDDEPFPVFVMVLTDGTEGSGNYNENEYVELVNELITNSITVHVVLLSSRGGSVINQYALNLTGNTGGIYENIAAATGIEQMLVSIADRMNAHYESVSRRYRVVYERPNPPGAQISASITRSGARIAGLFAGLRMQ